MKTLGKDAEAVKNGILATADIIKNILLYDGQIDVPFQFVCSLWEFLIHFLVQNNWTNDLNIASSLEFNNKTYLELLVDVCAISVKLSIHLFGLPRDYLSSLPKTVYEKRVKTIEILCIRSWIIFYLIIKQILSYETVKDTTIQMNASSSILEFLHTFLGDLKLCSADEGKINLFDILGRFLKFTIQELKNSDSEMGAYQCYFCLYGIILKVFY